MIKIERFVCNMFQENCYVVNDETGEAVIIDCGTFYEEERNALMAYIRNNNLDVKHLIATHGHLDHNFGNDLIEKELKLKVEVYSEDEELMNNLDLQTRQLLRMPYPFDIAPVGRYLHEDDMISFGRHQLSIIPTPGHSPGSVVFYCKEENIAFSGDTLFRMSIGRTDFAGGSYEEIIHSLKMLTTTLPPHTQVLPGHGTATTIGDEKLYNPYIR